MMDDDNDDDDDFDDDDVEYRTDDIFFQRSLLRHALDQVWSYPLWWQYGSAHAERRG